MPLALFKPGVMARWSAILLLVPQLVAAAPGAIHQAPGPSPTTPGRMPELTIDTWMQMATLTNATGATGDVLGIAVAISADDSTIAVGSYGVASHTGAVYVYSKPVDGWVTSSAPTAILTNAGSVAGDYFGVSVAISADGSTIIVGADSTANPGGGAAYVYTKPIDGWATTSAPTAILTNTTGGVNDQLGHAVAISGDGSVIIAGAPGVATNTGAVLVYLQPAGGWISSGMPDSILTNINGATYNFLGYAVAMSADASTIAAGAYGVANNKGAVHVYSKPNNGWMTSSMPNATLMDASQVLERR